MSSDNEEIIISRTDTDSVVYSIINKFKERADIGMKKYPISKELSLQISDYCKNNRLVDASKHFNLSLSTINRHKNYQE